MADEGMSSRYERWISDCKVIAESATALWRLYRSMTVTDLALEVEDCEKRARRHGGAVVTRLRRSCRVPGVQASIGCYWGADELLVARVAGDEADEMKCEVSGGAQARFSSRAVAPSQRCFL
jgi:hypothetical protein